MGRKKELSEGQLRMLIALFKEEANRPLEEFDFPAEPLSFDFEDIPASPAPVGVTVPANDSLPACGTHPICIRVPVWIIRAFKAKAACTGASYQTLMTRALRAGACG